MAETNVITEKKCEKCKSVLPVSSFNKNKSKRDGLGTECRPCANSYSKNYHAAHLDEHKARTAAYKKANPEKFKEWNRLQYERADKEAEKARKRDSYRTHQEKRLENSRMAWYRDHEKNLLRKKIYRQETRPLQLAISRARYMRQRRALASWANEENIKAMYRQAAWIEKMTGLKQHVDHYYPLKNDRVCGLHVENNLRIIPAFDNLSKGNRFPTEE